MRLLAAIAVLCLAAVSGVRAQSLYPSFLEPPFIDQPNTEFSAWDIFYAAYGLPNKPDIAAPNGSKSSATAAGQPTSTSYLPNDPQAFWNSLNPTITQDGTSTAFILGPGTSGNIYSFAEASHFVLRDSAPFTVGTVLLQFQSEGSVVDYDSIRLVYTSGGAEISLPPADIIKEYRGGNTPRGGVEGRSAVQWNLAGLGIASYEIRFGSAESSLSFQRALLDTAAVSSVVVPAKGVWTAGGAGDNAWSTAANWQAGVVPAVGANVLIENGATATLDSSRKIGELLLPGFSDFTLGASGGSLLTANTGIAVAAGGATHVIDAPFVMGGLQFDIIGGGSTLVINGPVTAGEYGGSSGAVTGGFVKEGSGTLVINGNIGTVAGSLLLEEGTLKLAGTNSQSGASAVHGGTLVLAANSPLNAAGAMGTNSSVVNVGTSNVSETDPPPSVVRVLVEGPRNIAKNFTVVGGNALVVFGGYSTGAGAVFSGSINLDTSNNVQLFAQDAGDKVTFSGNLGGGNPSRTITKAGAGTVVFSGNAKSYLNATRVQGGLLEVAATTNVSGLGAWQVGMGASLRVNGSLGGAGVLALDGGALTGSGSVAKSTAVNFGGRLAPGNGVGGMVFTAAQTWAPGGRYEWQIANASGAAGSGWDLARIEGAALGITASAGGKFLVYARGEELTGFDAGQEYQWEIVRAPGGITGFSSAAFAVNMAGFPAGVYWNAFSVVRDGNSLFLKYTPTAGPDPGPAPDPDPDPEPTPDPNPVPASGAGWLYVAEEDGGTVGRYAAETGSGAPFVTDVDLPQGLAVSGPNLLVGSFGSGVISAVNRQASGVAAPFISGLTAPQGIAVLGASVYVVNQAWGSIDKYDAATGAPVAVPFISGFTSPAAVAPFGASLLVADAGTGIVSKYNAQTGAVRDADFITGVSAPSALAVRGDNVFVASATANTVGRYAADGSPIDAGFLAGLDEPVALAVYGDTLFVANAGSGAVGAYDVSGADAAALNATLVTGLDRPVALAVAPVSSSVTPTPTPAPPTPVKLSVSGKKKVKTTKAKLKIKGVTSGPAAKVTYRVGTKGGFKKASGTTAWSFTAKKLRVGSNTITIVATAADGSTVTTRITVKRTAP